ncbi:methyltransferasehypothetical protein [Limosa lapponica baueri]|uniref:Methyltransferase-like protein 2 n=1 Tax=Limosa lapponica baueri TaxID=1758121 RepID=A0A2I0TC58_LIMLA|nr:methyltransferasehypothetical protein [Limosa lapponica baueri]
MTFLFVFTEEYEVNAKRYWDDFYKIHENGFFKDRHWLFTEFPELAPTRKPSQNGDSVHEFNNKEESDNEGLGSCANGLWAENQLNVIKSTPKICTEELAAQKCSELNQSAGDYPGSSASYRILECIVNRLSRLLKPGGMILLRDYGRYDLAQLRFKKGQCLSDNFYVRGDGTRVYFFTQGKESALAKGAQRVFDVT